MRPAVLGVAAVLVMFANDAHAQWAAPPPRQVRPPPAAPSDDEDEEQPAGVALRSRFGEGRAEVMLHSSDPETVRRGLARAAAIGSPEAIALIAQRAEELASADDRTLIDLARALAAFADQDAPRQRLMALLNVSTRVTTRSSAAARAAAAEGTSDSLALVAARVGFARDIAARALVASRDAKALEAVFTSAREPGLGQTAALRALASDPSQILDAQTAAHMPAPTSAAAAHALAQTGDLRVLGALRARVASGEPGARAAAIVALGQLGDGGALSSIVSAFGDGDARVRAASGEALVLLDAPQRWRAVEALVTDDNTADAGIRLAERAQDAGVVKALAARFRAKGDADVRSAILAALGRGLTDDAVKVLVSVAADPRWGGEAVAALGRSPNAGAMRALEALAREPSLRRLVARAYALRALLRHERSGALGALVAELARSRAPADRSVGVFARVALGEASADASLSDPDPGVRRAAAMGTLAGWDGLRLPAAESLLARMPHETDEATRTVLGIGLLDGDPNARVPTVGLAQRVEAGGPDGALSASAFAARAGDADKDKVDDLLSSTDPVLRAHTARGLARSEEPSATGKLAEAARYEAEPLVRFSEIAALAARPAAPARDDALRFAARFDPEARIREVARRGLAGTPLSGPSPVREIAWLRAASSEGLPPGSTMLAAYVTSEGVAIPIAFDADGYALVAGVPSGDGRVIFAPSFPQVTAKPGAKR